MTSPAISVIIPVYNVEQYLPNCLDSVISQDIYNIEILCINDSSSDSSVDILNRYAEKDSRITIFHHKKNKGQATARNIGLAQAKGEYVFFLDSDDILFCSNSLSHLFKIAKQNTADEVVGATLRWDEQTGEREFGYHKVYLQETLNGKTFAEAPYLASNVIGCNKLLKTAFLRERNLYFNPDLKKFEDIPFSWKVHLLARSISVSTQTSYLHRLRKYSNSLSIMQTKHQDHMYHVLVANEMLDFFEKNQQFVDIRHIVDRYFVQWLIRDVLEMNGKSIEQEDKKRILVQFRNIFARLPDTSTLHFSSRENSLLSLIHEKQYDMAWENILAIGRQKHTPNELKRLQNKLDAVHASTSWRITAPLRFATKNIKKYTTTQRS